MSSMIDQAFGIHAKALQLYERRAEVLANNLANADTPGYKARDIDFKAALAGAMGGDVRLARSSAGHLDAGGGAGSGSGSGAGAMDAPRLLYRVPLQPSADGNTVDGQTEQAQFMENAVRQQASFTFLDGTIKTLKSAIRGE